jgi:hypothetical protein
VVVWVLRNANFGEGRRAMVGEMEAEMEGEMEAEINREGKSGGGVRL